MVYVRVLFVLRNLGYQAKGKIDNSLDVFRYTVSVAFWERCAAWQLAELGVFSGYGFADGVNSIGGNSIQAMGVVATGLYTAIVTFVLLKLVGMVTNGIRVSQETNRKVLI